MNARVAPRLELAAIGGILLGATAFAVARAAGWPLLRLAAAAHLLVLCASVQVPSRLGWRDGLSSLSPFNRKLLWVYGGFTMLTIAGFGLLLWTVAGEAAAGGIAARSLVRFVGAWWTARIAVDLAVFRAEDWPSGRGFVAGHVALTGVFTAVALACWSAGLGLG